MAERSIDRTAELAVSRGGGITTVWLGAGEPARLIRTGAVLVGVTAADELICVSAPTPEAVDPGLNRI